MTIPNHRREPRLRGSRNRTQEYDSDGSPSRAVVEAIADVAGIDPLELDPTLGEVVDPDALDALFGDSRQFDGSVTFDYAGHSVEVRCDSPAVVREQEPR